MTRSFVLHLQDGRRWERIPEVTSFIAEDASGSFGILPGHARMMTSLTFGLARFRVGESRWELVAVPGALLYFAANELFLSTRHYLRGGDDVRIRAALEAELAAEEEALRGVRESLRRLEEEMLRRLWQIGRAGPYR